MNAAMGYVLLPWIVISSTALIVMLFTAIKRDHQYISLISSLGLLIALIVQVIQIGATEYQNELVIIDGMTSLLSAVLIFVSFLISLLLYPWLESIKDPKEEYYMLFLLATQGGLIICASNHFGSFFLGLELMSLSLVTMVAYPDNNPKSLEASIKYLVLSAIASAFMLMAIAIIYFFSGTLEIQKVVDQLPTLSSSNNTLYSVAIIFLLVGVAFKLSLAPCHLWVADLFEGAPLPTAALLATLSKAAIFIVLIRLFSSGDWHNQTYVTAIISAIAAASMIIGNFLALLQKNILRLLAFSSIAHFGYILLAILAIKPNLPLTHSTTLANEAAIFYLLAYLVTVVGTFSILILLSNNKEVQPPTTFTIDNLRGLFWIKPFTSIVLTLLLLSLAGIPLTVGFIGKFYLTLAAVNSQLWWLLATLIIGSITGLFYYLRIILMMMEKSKEDAEPMTISLPISGHFVLGVVTLLVIGLGILPGRLASLIESLIS